jgi:hypothetical protein
MKRYLMLLCALTSCSPPSNNGLVVHPESSIAGFVSKAVDTESTPSSKPNTLVLTYNAIACSCAQWSELKDSNKEDKGTHYWLEPANDKLVKADTLYNGENLPIQIKVTGQVVAEHGFPEEGNLSKTGPEEAGKVFRYTTITILKKGTAKKRS